jgi:hypothetical protein
VIFSLILAFGLAGQPASGPDCLCSDVFPNGGAANLVVQVVTQDWLPHPGASVRLSGKFEGTDAVSVIASANRNGVLCVRVPHNALYALDFDAAAGFEAVHKDIRLLKPSPSLPVAYVQIVTPVAVSDDSE